MAEFEDDSDAAKIMKRRVWIDFWIHDCDAIRERRSRRACEAGAAERGLVMIQHNHVHATLTDLSNLSNRRCAAIDRD